MKMVLLNKFFSKNACFQILNQNKQSDKEVMKNNLEQIKAIIVLFFLID